MTKGVYIAGAMRGQPAFGFHEFFSAEVELRYIYPEGTKFFNPAARDESTGFLPRAWDLTGAEDLTKPVTYWCNSYRTFRQFDFDLATAMTEDLDYIRSDECTDIVLLPGWAPSEGSRGELELAFELGRTVLFLKMDEIVPYLDSDPEEEDVRWCLDNDYSWKVGLLNPFKDAAPEIADLNETWLAENDRNNETRVTSITGGQKGTKPERHDLIPGHALDAVARVYHFGASKYDDHNWRKGYPWSLSLAALQRHTNALKKGQWNDPESAQPHLAHAVFHCLALLEWAAEGNTEQNDIYGLDVP